MLVFGCRNTCCLRNERQVRIRTEALVCAEVSVVKRTLNMGVVL